MMPSPVDLLRMGARARDKGKNLAAAGQAKILIVLDDLNLDLDLSGALKLHLLFFHSFTPPSAVHTYIHTYIFLSLVFLYQGRVNQVSAIITELVVRSLGISTTFRRGIFLTSYNTSIHPYIHTYTRYNSKPCIHPASSQRLGYCCLQTQSSLHQLLQQLNTLSKNGMWWWRNVRRT